MLVHVPEVMNAAQLATLRGALERADWGDGRATAGPQGAQVKHNRQLDEHSPLANELGRGVLEALAKQPLFMSAALPLRIVPPLFNRYEGGERYGLHIDGAIRHVPHSVTRIRTDLSCTLFLTDPADYDGGELVVMDTYGAHEVKLPAGDLIVYPASSLHQVTPVTRGVRTSSFFWVQSLVRDDGERRALFELDTQIQKLRGRIGDTDEVLALTGHYHNLLRKWSHT
ncbi:MAG TPA: Fe2+-dependent dioxygenase [Burkholderiaceae bacterium]|nr:Fe2+-dependent dioxygenase [Burkholderiaceae bacterium]